ncbi:cardiolipin synthase [Coraliomargarita sp. W4R72]
MKQLGRMFFPEKGHGWRRKRSLVLLFLLAHLVGFFSSIDAIMSTRTPQGAAAWAIGLNTVPLILVPAYWVFGEVKFESYALARQEGVRGTIPQLKILRDELNAGGFVAESAYGTSQLLEAILPLPPTTHNEIELLIDGQASFQSMFDGISNAQDYVLIQFFTLHDREVGQELADRLIERAAAGVRCYVLYDQMGTKLSDPYKRRLIDAGVEMQSYNVASNPLKLFRLNFRNHRKLIVVDGQIAWTGGMNIKDDYLDWRDTMVKIRGPVVPCMQYTFVEDWAWARSEVVEDLRWTPQSASEEGGATIASLPSGPSAMQERYSLFLLDLIHRAQDRLWIASPYFVPTEPILLALQGAARRGVELRILIPDETDTMIAKIAQFAAWGYVRELEAAGAEMYQYTTPFMHQKIILVDDEFVAIGSANFDNRSFRLNFELTAAVTDRDFNREVATMLTRDFGNATPVTQAALDERGFFKRFTGSLSRLLAPVL